MKIEQFSIYNLSEEYQRVESLNKFKESLAYFLLFISRIEKLRNLKKGVRIYAIVRKSGFIILLLK